MPRLRPYKPRLRLKNPVSPLLRRKRQTSMQSSPANRPASQSPYILDESEDFTPPPSRRIKPKLPKNFPKPLKVQSLNKLLPNIITITAVCAGLSSIRFALESNWRFAVMAILCAAVLDTMDGRIARLLKASSSLGAQLDSLADNINFGVAPALLLYLWALQYLGPIGWIPVLIYCVCATLRLARFNVELDEPPLWPKSYFTGIPSPAAAALALCPVMVGFELGPQGDLSVVTGIIWSGASTMPQTQYGWLMGIAIWLGIVGLLMIIPFASFSGKHIHIPAKWITLILLAIGTIVALLIISPWLTAMVLCLVYVATLPISAFIGFTKYQRSASTQSSKTTEP